VGGHGSFSLVSHWRWGMGTWRDWATLPLLFAFWSWDELLLHYVLWHDVLPHQRSEAIYTAPSWLSHLELEPARLWAKKKNPKLL
jgi:hypothetical protein